MMSGTLLHMLCVCVQIFLSFPEWSFGWSSFLAALSFCQRFSLLHCEEGWENITLTHSIIARAALETPDLLSKSLKTLFDAWVSYTNQRLMTWSRMSRWAWNLFQPPTGHVVSLPLTQWGQPWPFTPIFWNCQMALRPQFCLQKGPDHCSVCSMQVTAASAPYLSVHCRQSAWLLCTLCLLSSHCDRHGGGGDVNEPWGNHPSFPLEAVEHPFPDLGFIYFLL